MPSSTDVKNQLKILGEGISDLISEGELVEKLKLSCGKKRPLRVKYGADPSSPDLHLGHTVPLRKLRQFQELGHTVVFIIGDFTALIGDPSQRNETRPMLSREAIKKNALTYQNQVFRILDRKRTEVRYNSEWLEKMKPSDFLHLLSQYTVARILERDDFQKRYRANLPITLLEFLYPLLQGYDSVVVKADVEIGGTDQKFNLIVGRELQKAWNQPAQVVMTLPLLEGTDGVQKMSKSFGNAIAVQDPPRDMFGKIMSVPDTVFPRYVQYAGGMPAKDGKVLIDKFREQPREAKADFAEHVVGLYHNAGQARKAREEFDRMFRDKGLPDEVQTVTLAQETLDIVSLLKESGLVASKSEARRLIDQGGVKIDQEKITDSTRMVALTKPVLVQCGKRKFAKVQYDG